MSATIKSNQRREQLILRESIVGSQLVRENKAYLDSGQYGQIDFLHVTNRVGWTVGNISRGLRIPTGGS